MKKCVHSGRMYVFLFALLLITTITPAAWAQYWVSFASDTRYVALGDSLTSGYASHPVTQGFAYELYQSGVIDNINHLHFCNIGIPGAMSEDVLNHQVPQVQRFFKETGENYRKVVTLTVGGNDMMEVLKGKRPEVVLATFAGNLTGILANLVNSFPDIRIYVANQYAPKLPVEDEALLVAGVNQVIAGVVGIFPENAVLVDIFSAFDGKPGLLLIEKNGSEPFQIHPTRAGHKVMADAFAAAIAAK